jgi:hypothetical protein
MIDLPNKGIRNFHPVVFNPIVQHNLLMLFGTTILVSAGFKLVSYGATQIPKFVGLDVSLNAKRIGL